MQAQISVEVQKESMGTILITLFFLKVHEREPMRLSRFLRSSSCYFYAAFMSSSFFNSYHQPLNLPFVKRLTGAIKNIWDGKWMVWSVFDLLHFWFLQMHCILQQHKVGGVAIICAKTHLYFASHVVSFMWWFLDSLNVRDLIHLRHLTMLAFLSETEPHHKQ